MKAKDWNEVLNHLDQDLVEEYIAKKDKKSSSKRPFWMATMAAALALTVGISLLSGKGILPRNAPSLETIPTASATRPIIPETTPPATTPAQPVIVPLNNLVYEPTYPQMCKYPQGESSDINFYEAVREWEKERKKHYQQPNGYADSLTNYFHRSIAQFLQGSGNQVYSPLNVYLAMAMLAETTDGNSRQQILDLFGLDTIEQLRQQVNYLWNAHYCDDGQTEMLLANSVWLDESYTFDQQTVQILAQQYYASSFSGDLGTEEMNKQLQSWLNENTGGMLTEQANAVEMPDRTVLSLASAVYFTATWESKFPENKTRRAVFHCQEGDVTVPFMNKSIREAYYWGENFTAVNLELTGGNRMWLILPDEGYTTADVLASEEYLQMTLDPEAWENQKELKINLSLPKFDVVQQQDLVAGMQALGLTDVFDMEAADFSPLTEETPLCVDGINHAARVVIDEEGCKGAAFTVLILAGFAPLPEVEEIDLALDRPFIFTVSSQDNLPLFAGVVNRP